MDWIAILNAAVVMIGVPTIGVWLISIGRKLQKIDELKESVDRGIAPDLKDVRERFVVVEDRVGSLWKDKLAPANSPRQLSEKGANILETSGIKSIVEKNKEKLTKLVQEKNVNNAYDAEQVITEIMFDLPTHCPEVIDELKKGAFNSGVDLGAVLFVGSIYLRNLIFPTLGFELDDLDKHHDGKK